MRKLCFVLFALFIVNAVAQDRNCAVNYFAKAVEKNILIYRIKTSNIVDNNLKGNFLKNHNDFLKVLPDYGYRLCLDKVNVDLQYPDSTFKLYGFFKKYDKFVSDSGCIEPSITFFNFDRYFLIAANSKNEIKFISGNFFQTAIGNDFLVEKNNPESYFSYLLMRTYNLQTENIQFVKKTRKKLYFSAYSKEANKEITLIIKTNNIEEVLIEY